MMRQRLIETLSGEFDNPGPSQASTGSQQNKGGGPCRAFFSKSLQGLTSLGDSALFKELSAEYRRIKAEGGAEFAELQRLGRLGTEAHRVGGHSFVQPSSSSSSTVALPDLSGLFAAPTEQLAIVPSRIYERVPLEEQMVALQVQCKQQKTEQYERQRMCATVGKCVCLNDGGGCSCIHPPAPRGWHRRSFDCFSYSCLFVSFDIRP
jgi:hypothetical protein